MKKYFAILLFLSLLIVITGCSKTVEKIGDIFKNNEDNFNAYIDNNYKKFDWFDDNIKFDDISDFSSSNKYFVTKEGKLYRFDLEKKYKSTNMNYEQIDSQIKFKRFMRGKIVSEDDNYYTYSSGIMLADDKEWDSNSKSLCNKVYKEYPNIYLVANDWMAYRHSYLYYDNENLYLFKYKEKSNNVYFDGESVCIYEKTLVNPSNINNEKFISASGYVFKTDKGYYNITIKEVISEYADEENYSEDIISKMDISKYYDKIFYFNGSVLLLKDDLSHIYINKDKDGYWYNFKG